MLYLNERPTELAEFIAFEKVTIEEIISYRRNQKSLQKRNTIIFAETLTTSPQFIITLPFIDKALSGWSEKMAILLNSETNSYRTRMDIELLETYHDSSQIRAFFDETEARIWLKAKETKTDGFIKLFSFS